MADIFEGFRPPCVSLNEMFPHKSLSGSSKGSVKGGCLTPCRRPVQFGKTCQELPPTGIALRVHCSTQPQQGNEYSCGAERTVLQNNWSILSNTEWYCSSFGWDSHVTLTNRNNNKVLNWNYAVEAILQSNNWKFHSNRLVRKLNTMRRCGEGTPSHRPTPENTANNRE